MKYLVALIVFTCSLWVGSWTRGQELPSLAGRKAPPISVEKVLQAPDGAEASWEKLRGKVVVLEFWATWCGPCVDAIPHINELAQQFKDKPVQFIALTEENQQIVEPFLAKKPIQTWVGVARHSMFDNYHVIGIPLTVVVRADGIIDAVTSPTALRSEHLQNLLAGKPSGLQALPAMQGTRAGELPEANAHTYLFQIVIRPTPAAVVGSATFGGGAGGGPMGREIGKSIIGYTLKDMLPSVYDVSSEKIIVKGNLPDGKYDLVAKIPALDEKHLGLRIQQALESTFGLTSRRERRDVDVYVATVVQGNAKGLMPTATPHSGRMASDPAKGTMSGVNATTTLILQAMERGLSRPVLDETKLNGGFDFELKWDPTTGRDGEVQAVRQQLGLVLTPSKQKVEVVVIDASVLPRP